LTEQRLPPGHDAARPFTPATLEDLTGLAVDRTSAAAIFRHLPDLRYVPVGPARQRELFAEIETLIAERRFRVVGNDAGQDVWEKGWRELADKLRGAAVVDIEALKPQYFHRGVPIRLLGEYVVPETPYFEYYAGVALRRQLIGHFLAESEALLELGCGTGINLLLAAELFPNARLVGSDWTRASAELLAVVSRGIGRTITPVLYDMLDGQGGDDLPITPETDVLTVHALEQLGRRAPSLIEFLLRKRPRRCLHIEPILDFYDPADPFDDIARRYHLGREYLQGLVPTLRHLAAEAKLEILAQRRVKLGNTYHEAYSYTAWRPA
jgi:SAM-dependent methyltransferase